MKLVSKITVGVIFLVLGAIASAQQQASDTIEVAPGISLRPNGLIAISDFSVEVAHFDANWVGTEQHNVFFPASPAEQSAPTTAPSSHAISGVFRSASGPFKLTERFVADDGVNFSATMVSEKELATKELSINFTFPAALFGGKPILIDDQPFTLPATPPQKTEANLLNLQNVHRIELSAPAGTLILTGSLSLNLVDSRAWGGQTYALQLQFSPSQGQIKESKIEFQMKWRPSPN